MRYHLTPVRKAITLKLRESKHWGNWGPIRRKGDPCALLMGMQIGAATVESSMEAPQKMNSRTTIWSRNPTSGYVSEGNEMTGLRSSLHPHIYCVILYNSQGKGTTSGSINK